MSASVQPKVFISYAWGNETHQDRVLRLAGALQGTGVEVVLDRWDLQPGQDMTVFMERTIDDPTITHVLILMDPNYATKANARAGGVGTETQLISFEVYRDPRQTRYVPVVFAEHDGRPFLPHFLRSRLYFDFSSDQAWETNWPSLLRHLFGSRPARPPLGTPDSALLQAHEHRAVPKGAAPATPATSPDVDGTFQQIYRRLHEVLTWHDLDPVRAATLLHPFGMTVGVLANANQTVEHLSEAFLRFFTDYFQVSRDYLLCRSSQPGIEAGHWYKDPRRLCRRIAELHREDSLGAVAFLAREDAVLFGARPVRLFNRSADDGDDMVPVLVVRRMVDEHEVYTYEVWETGQWEYPNCRLDLKVIALFCEQLNSHTPVVHLKGGTLKGKVFEAITQRRLHIAQHVTGGFFGMGRRWHPGDYVTTLDHLAKGQAELPLVAQWYARYGLDQLMGPTRDL